MSDPRLVPPSLNGDTRTMALMGLLDRFDALDRGILSDTYQPQTSAYPQILPFLADQLGVLDSSWNMAGTIQVKQGLILNALALQRRRGTPAGIKQALATIGWPGMTLAPRTAAGWAHYEAVQPLNGNGMTLAQLNVLLAVLAAWAPARCVLDSIKFVGNFASSIPGNGPHYDGIYKHDGMIKYEGALVATIATIKAGPGSPTVQLAAPTITVNPGQVVIQFVVGPGDANGLTLDTFAVYTAAGTLVAEATAPPIAKTPQVTLALTWTLTLT